MSELLKKPPRLIAIDSVRGVIIVLMIIEHCRQLLSGIIIRELPGVNALADLSVASVIIRSLSHLCSPGFFFLLGISAVLAIPKKLPQVIGRGVLLMGLQVTVVNLSWVLPNLLRGDNLGFHDQPIYLGEIFSLGCAAITVGLVRSFSPRVICAIALTLGISLLSFSPEWLSSGVLGFLFSGIWENTVEVPYPLFPWTMVALLGAAFAKTFLDQRDNTILQMRQPIILVAGFSALGIFAILGGDFYKYPPSFLFLFITVLAIMLLIKLFRKIPVLNIYWLQALGRHPLFIYVLHLYLIGTFAVAFHGSNPIQALAMAFAVTVVCVIVVSVYEASALSSNPRNVFDTYSDFYDQFMRLFRLYRPEEVSRSLPLRADGYLLDIAGGTGFLAAQLRKRFARVVLVDLSQQMLAVARKRGLAGLQGSALALPFASNSFVAVVCTDALHHIKDSDSVIREMSRVLRSNGRVVIQEFHIKGVFGLIFFLLERLFVDRSQFLTPDELKALMAKHGFVGATRTLSRIGYIYEGYLSLEKD